MRSPVKDGEKGELEDLLMEAGLKGPTPVGSLRSLYRVFHVVKGGYGRFKGRTDPVLTLLLIVWEDTGLVEVGVASQPHNIDKRICWAPFVCGLWTGVETGSWWWW